LAQLNKMQTDGEIRW